MNVEGKVIRGTTVILHCEITSVPDFTSLTWLKNGDAITMTINNTKYNGGTNHKPSLTINNVDNTDKAVYTCEVTNLAGTGTSNSVTFNIISMIIFLKNTMNVYNGQRTCSNTMIFI